MKVGDLIEELQKFPELSTVFIQRDTGDREIHRLDSIHEIWVRTCDGSGIHGPYIEVKLKEDGNAEDYGVLLYG